MAFFALRSVPGAAWPAVPDARVGQMWSVCQELDRTQWLDPEELEKLQLQQVRALLAHCHEHVPYYRRALDAAGIGGAPVESMEQFRRVPPLTRELYQANADDMKARRLPEGTTEVGHSFTSGTSGVPIKLFVTNRVAMWWSALSLRDMEWCGVDPRGDVAAIRLQVVPPEHLPRFMAGTQTPYGNEYHRLLLHTGHAYAMDIRQDPRVQLEWLRRVRPRYLISLPTNLDALAGMVRESGQALAELEVIQAMGEAMPEATRRRIEEGFGVPVKNTYSATEVGYIASPCPLGHGLHVHGENVVAEVLDADNNPCRPGQTGRLVVTSLHNFVSPFVRYEIMDEVTTADGPCPCGRGLPLWKLVDGRRHPFIHLRDGRRKTSLGLTMNLRKVGGMHQFQFIQRAIDHAVVRVVPDRTWTADHAERMRRVVHHEFEWPIPVEVETKEFIERPRGGKLRMIVIELEGQGS